jgi:hypothetical protein
VDDLLVLAYYIDGQQNEEAEALQEALDNLGVDFELSAYDDQGSPEANSSLQPTFLREKLIETFEEYDDLLYLDPTARLLQLPMLLAHLKMADVGIYYDQQMEFWRSDVMYLHRSAKCLELLDRWGRSCTQNRRKFNPHRLFSEAVQAVKALTVHELPEPYAWTGESVDYEPVVRVEPYAEAI